MPDHDRNPLPCGVCRIDYRWPNWAHAIVLGLILAGTALLYQGVTKTYFCSDDDFIETHRSVFEDRPAPARIFTTGHFRSFKYRPLNRLLNLGTYSLGGGRAWAYRLRNLAVHLANVSLVYVLALMLGSPAPAAAAAALLFGWHPLANQTLIGAVDTNSVAHGLVLLALVLLIGSVRNTRRAAPGAAAAALLVLVATLFYETDVTGFAILLLYLGMEWWLRPRPALRTALRSLIFTGGALMLAYLFVRNTLVHFGTRLPQGVSGIGAVFKGLVMYTGAVLLPVDPVLASAFLGTPLPSEPGYFAGRSAVLIAVSGLAVMVIILGMAVDLYRVARPAASWAIPVFLLVSAFLPLIPVLLAADHPSETYVYLPLAFVCLLAAPVFYRWCELRTPRYPARVFGACVMAAAALFGAGTLVRNGRVIECGDAAQRIVNFVPRSPGQAAFVFADMPGERPSRHYGFYGFRGLDCISNRAGFRSENLQKGLQLATGNGQLSASALSALEMKRWAAKPRQSGQTGFWVHDDGSLTGDTGSRPPN